MKWGYCSIVVLGLFLITRCDFRKSDHRDLGLMNSIGEDFMLNAFLENREVDPNLRLYNVRTGEVKLVSEFFGDSILFFYFESTHCNACVENEIRIQNELFDKDKLILWTKSHSNRALQVFAEIHQIPFDIWRLESLDPFPYLAWNRPIYFELDDLGTFGHVYSPKFSYLELSEAYLNAMKKYRY